MEYEEALEGLTVLNTTGGEVSTQLAERAIFIIVMCAFVAAVFFAVAIVERNPVFSGVTAVCVFIATIAYITPIGYVEEINPLRYEVTVNPGHVIDAAWWEIVEQRGEIYVIQARKGAGADE